VLSPLVPRLAARWGAERLLGGALVVLASGIAVRWVSTAAALFTGSVLIGSGIAVGNVLLPGLIKRDFPTRVGLLTGAYATVMGGVAAVASGVAVPISEAAPGGWSTALGCWVLLVLAAVLLWLPQLRRSPVPPARANRGPRLPWGSGLAWAVTAFMGLQSLGFYVVVTWLPEILQDNGAGAARAGWLLFLLQAVALLTGLAVPGALRWARDQRALAAICSAVLLLGYLGLLLAPGRALLWSVVLGLGGGACLVLALAFLGLRAQDAAGAGALSAMAQSVGYLLAAVGPVVFGLLHTVSSGWRAPLSLVCCAAAAQTLVALVAGRGTVRSAAGR
jgi:MFS transporter, CP family, cyanate transporter